MKFINLKNKNEIKLVWVISILTFICAYMWNVIVTFVVEVYQVKKLGNREIANVFMDNLASTSLPFQLILSLGTEFTLLITAYFIIKKYNDGEFNITLIGMKEKEENTKKLFLLGVVASSLMTFVIFGGLTAFGYAKFLGSDYVNGSAFNILMSIIVALILGISAGFAEEIVFRGIILKYLINKKGKVFALIASSLIFSIGHINRLDLLYLLYTFLIGIFLGSLYIIADSIYLPIGFHFAWNTYSYLISVNGDNFVNIKSALNFNINNNIYFISIILSFGALLCAFMMKKLYKISTSL